MDYIFVAQKIVDAIFLDINHTGSNYVRTNSFGLKVVGQIDFGQPVDGTSVILNTQ